MTTAGERCGGRPTAARFSEAEADAAWESWGANCGPGALAGILGLTLDDVRPHLEGFEAKGYTNPRMMYDALDSLGVRWRKLAKGTWPRFGLVRVMWTGPWSYWWERERHTHWIGTAMHGDDRGIFDVNCINNGTGWTAFHEWTEVVVPHLLGQYPKADGDFLAVNALEIE